MAWLPTGAKSLSKAIVTQINAHICVTQSQRYNGITNVQSAAWRIALKCIYIYN